MSELPSWVISRKEGAAAREALNKWYAEDLEAHALRWGEVRRLEGLVFGLRLRESAATADAVSVAGGGRPSPAAEELAHRFAGGGYALQNMSELGQQEIERIAPEEANADACPHERE
jgi:hypothetical protein